MKILYRWQIFASFTLLACFLLGTRCEDTTTKGKTPLAETALIQHAKSHPFDAEDINDSIALISSSPHPFGSARQAKLADILFEKANSYGWDSHKDIFLAEVPNPKSNKQNNQEPLSLEKQGINIIARPKTPSSCVILIGSHYDSKRMESFDYLAANDSASSSAALFWILDALQSYDQSKLACDFVGIWFDGEEAYLDGWNDGILSHPARITDNTYGSRHFVSKLIECDNKKPHCLKPEFGGGRVKALILLDLIGSPALQLTNDTNSNDSLVSLAKRLDKTLFGEGQLFSDSPPSQIQDDHIPFVKHGIQAIDLIDFENLEHWHNASDTIDNISLESIEKASRLSIALALTLSERS